MKNPIQKTLVSIVVIGMLTILLAGCSTVKFYSDPGLTTKTGLKFYTVKPYLQVERSSPGGNILKATIVYLPDLAHPQYLLMKEGLGSKKLDLKLTDQLSISTLGISTDSKIPEIVEAFASLAGKSAEAAKEISTIAREQQSAQPVKTDVELYEVLFEGNQTILKKIEIK